MFDYFSATLLAAIDAAGWDLGIKLCQKAISDASTMMKGRFGISRIS